MRAFVTVADELGFSAAARRLNTSAPSITRAINDLEQRLGARLLHRTTRSVRLTEAGARYLNDCRQILSSIEDAEMNAAGIHADPRGTVILTASLGFGRMVLPSLLRDFLDRYPDLSVEALFLDRVIDLMEEGIDVAIRIADLPASNLIAVRVGSVRRLLCAAPGYLDEYGTPETPQQLRSHNFIDFVNMTPNGEWDFLEDQKRTVFRPDARFRVNNADAAIAAALDGRGITRVLSYMISKEVRSGQLQVILEDQAPPPTPVYVVHKEKGQASARVRALVDYLVASLRQNPALD
ncbi:MAG: LysR family transcriptional regulator [Kiloniellales bacterium]|nr:LysR family transcriptional regulator [Kiloniellales bacterium]